MARYIIGLYVLFNLSLFRRSQTLNNKKWKHQLQDEQTITKRIFLYDRTPQKYAFWVRNSIMKSNTILWSYFWASYCGMLFLIQKLAESFAQSATLMRVSTSTVISPNDSIQFWTTFLKRSEPLKKYNIFFGLLDF